MSQTGDDTLATLATPCLVIDAAVVERNLQGLAKYAAQHRLKVRPHTKTHKSLRLARLQMEAGACGLTVAKAGEAAVMAEAANDILVAYPAVDSHRCRELARMAQKISVRVAIDSAAAAQALAASACNAGSTIGILIDIDAGMHRTGVQSPREALELGQAVSTQRGLRLDGIMFYPGHISGPAATQAAALASVEALVAETISLFKKSGLNCSIVSGGSTPTLLRSHLVPSQTEIRPGTYIFNDMNCVHGGSAALEECAARLVCTVVSDAVPNQIVLDGGTKTFTSDRCGPAPESGHGFILEYPKAKIVKLTEEHAQVDVSACERRPRIGERVSVIPNHICPCVNLQDSAWVREKDGSIQPLKVDARGKLV
ncbi:MAG TPA: alanine racemase [Planctomycetota bacterium]|nr:alanine racemase [Planctomycetota bacterium]